MKHSKTPFREIPGLDTGGPAHRPTRRAVVAGAAAAAAAAVALAVPGLARARRPEAPQARSARGLLFTEAGNPLAQVPGRSDGLVLTGFSVGAAAYGPQARQWVAAASASSPDASLRPSVLLFGDRRAATASAVQNEPLPGFELAFDRNPDTLAVNDAGDAAFGMTALGASTADRVLIARRRAATGLFETVARQNDLIPNFGAAVPGADGERFGSSFGLGSVLRDGRVVFVCRSTSGAVASDRDDFLLIEGDPPTVLVQVGALVPGGQAGGGTAALVNFDRRAYATPDGRRWLLWGQLGSTGNPDIVVRHGQAVLQEGVPVPGLPGEVFAPTIGLGAGGHWYARGRSTAGVGYLIADGMPRVIAGQPIDFLQELGPVARIDLAAFAPRGDLAVALSLWNGEPLIVVFPAGGGTPFVAVDSRTRMAVGGSPRGPLFYGGTIGLEMVLADDGTLMFWTRARDLDVLNVADGLFVTRVALPG